MNLVGVGKRVRIYIGESDLWHAQPLFLALLETLRSEGAAGATVLRGIAGFGAHTRIHTVTIVRLAEDLPIVVEWIDAPDRVARVLPKITPMVSEGLITVEDVQITHHQFRVVDDISARLRVGEVMTRDVVYVRPETPLREAVGVLASRGYRALPIVDAQDRVVGIVTNGDLVERGGLRVRIELLGALTAEQMAHGLALVEDEKTAADVMTSPVVTTHPDTPLNDAAHLMVARHLKRLPVVSPDGQLLGMISRVDLLRTHGVAYPPPPTNAVAPTGPTIGDVARTDIPVVGPGAPLAEVLDAVISSRLNRALVVDDRRHVVGVVSDAELLRRLSPEDHPRVLSVLMSRLPFVHLSLQEQDNLQHALGTTAEQIMDPNIATVRADTPVGEAIEIMLRDRRKILPVVDSDGLLVGATDRADLLRTLVALERENGSS